MSDFAAVFLFFLVVVGSFAATILLGHLFFHWWRKRYLRHHPHVQEVPKPLAKNASKRLNVLAGVLVFPLAFGITMVINTERQKYWATQVQQLEERDAEKRRQQVLQREADIRANRLTPEGRRVVCSDGWQYVVMRGLGVIARLDEAGQHRRC